MTHPSPILSPAAVDVGQLLAALPAVGATVAAVFLTIGLGAEFRRRGWLDERADASLLSLLVRVFIPALIVTRVIGNPSLGDWRNLAAPPAMAFGLVTLGFAVAALALMLIGGGERVGLGDARAKRTFVLCTGMFNYGYITIPLVESIFDSRTLGVLFVFNVGVEAAMWGVGVTILAGALAKGWWRRLFSPPVVATILAVALNLLIVNFDLGERTPAAILPIINALWRSLGWLGQAAIPIGLLLTGATIYENWSHCRLRQGTATVGLATLVRVAALPVVFLALAVFLPAALVTRELRAVLVLQAAMPAAVFPIVLSRHYGGDVGVALRIVVGTSLISLLTMPLWIVLGLWLIG